MTSFTPFLNANQHPAFVMACHSCPQLSMHSTSTRLHYLLRSPRRSWVISSWTLDQHRSAVVLRTMPHTIHWHRYLGHFVRSTLTTLTQPPRKAGRQEGRETTPVKLHNVEAPEFCDLRTLGAFFEDDPR